MASSLLVGHGAVLSSTVLTGERTHRQRFYFAIAAPLSCKSF